jgi:hypothetical protein
MVPHAFLCPITCDVMDRPVVAADGHSYELEAITRWLESHTTSPLTNAQLHNTVLVPNVALRNAIEEWRAVQPMAIDPERLSFAVPEELIGEGSFGRVVAGVLATHGREQRVAVKTLPAPTQKEMREQFEKELKAHITAQQVEMRLRAYACATQPAGRAVAAQPIRRSFANLARVLAAGCGRGVPSARHVREEKQTLPRHEALRAQPRRLHQERPARNGHHSKHRPHPLPHA